MAKHVLAVDLGADSGRVCLVTWADDAVQLQVAHRFANGSRQIDGHLRWEVKSLFAGIREGLQIGAAMVGGDIAAIGIDAWGVDYALVDADLSLIEEPICYRDPRTSAVQAGVIDRLGGASALYAATGTRSMAFNTLFQLAAHHAARPPALASAQRILSLPALFTAWLGGEPLNEWTWGGTTNLTRAGTMAWDPLIVAASGARMDQLGPLVRSGTGVGRVRDDLCHQLGFRSPPLLVAVGSHDTASAVAALPTEPDGTAYISCGTWSLLGVMRNRPHTGPDVLASSFSNEIAVDGTIRLLRNIMGLWVAQECRRDRITSGSERSWEDLLRLAESTAPATWSFTIDDQALFAPSQRHDRMIDRVVGRCSELGLSCGDDGALFRRIWEALAQAYAQAIGSLDGLGLGPIRRVALLGGGSRNRLLATLTAQATKLPVIAGPTEATALGNALAQGVALGWCGWSDLPRLAASAEALTRISPRSNAVGGSCASTCFGATARAPLELGV